MSHVRRGLGQVNPRPTLQADSSKFPILSAFLKDWLFSWPDRPQVGYCSSPNEDISGSIVDLPAHPPIKVSIPDELHRNPIRNGSTEKIHGFNPLNSTQHHMIRDYLDTEVKPQILGHLSNSEPQ